MNVRDFYIAVAGDYAAALAALGSDEGILARLRLFPNEEDYAGLLPALRESRWADALVYARHIHDAAVHMCCTALAGSSEALCRALQGPDPLGDVPPVQEKLARDYRMVVAGINGIGA